MNSAVSLTHPSGRPWSATLRAHLFCHYGKPVDGRSSLLHEGKQLVEELFPFRVVVDLIKLGNRGVLRGRLVKVCLFSFGKSDKQRKAGGDKARINYFLRASPSSGYLPEQCVRGLLAGRAILSGAVRHPSLPAPMDAHSIRC